MSFLGGGVACETCLETKGFGQYFKHSSFQMCVSNPNTLCSALLIAKKSRVQMGWQLALATHGTTTNC